MTHESHFEQGGVTTFCSRLSTSVCIAAVVLSYNVMNGVYVLVSPCFVSKAESL